jgi:hypothetical protein
MIAQHTSRRRLEFYDDTTLGSAVTGRSVRGFKSAHVSLKVRFVRNGEFKVKMSPFPPNQLGCRRCWHGGSGGICGLDNGLRYLVLVPFANGKDPCI